MRAAGWLAAATALVLAAKVEDSSVPQLAELQARTYPLTAPRVQGGHASAAAARTRQPLCGPRRVRALTAAPQRSMECPLVFTVEHLAASELNMLHKLDWSLSAPTSLCFLEFFVRRAAPRTTAWRRELRCRARALLRRTLAGACPRPAQR